MESQDSPRLLQKELRQTETLTTWKSQELREYDSEEVVRSPISLFERLIHRPYNSEELVRNFEKFGLNPSLRGQEEVIVPQQLEIDRDSDFVENISPNESSYGRSQQPQSGSGCNCSKCGCKKAYCPCWQKGISCSQKCKCINCHNQQKEEQLLITPKKTIFSGVQRCSCKNSQCKQKHCSCHQGNRRCTSNCLCVQCGNRDERNSASRSMFTRSFKLGSMPSKK